MFSGSGSAVFADGAATAAGFNSPAGLAYDATGTVLYVAVLNHHRVRSVSISGTVSTLAGSGVAGCMDGTGAGAQLSYPAAVAVSPLNGYIFSADWIGCLIRSISPAGVTTTLAGYAATATCSAGGFQDGTGTSANLLHPSSSLASIFILFAKDFCVTVIPTGRKIRTRVS